MKLTEMKGASLLPVRKETQEGLAEEYFIAKGHNSAVAQLEQCRVEVDEVELAKVIELYLEGIYTSLEIAEKLSNCKQNWLRLEKKI